MCLLGQIDLADLEAPAISAPVLPSTLGGMNSLERIASNLKQKMADKERVKEIELQRERELGLGGVCPVLSYVLDVCLKHAFLHSTHLLLLLLCVCLCVFPHHVCVCVCEDIVAASRHSCFQKGPCRNFCLWPDEFVSVTSALPSRLFSSSLTLCDRVVVSLVSRTKCVCACVCVCVCVCVCDTPNLAPAACMAVDAADLTDTTAFIQVHGSCTLGNPCIPVQ